MTAAMSPHSGVDHDFMAFTAVGAWLFDLDNTLYPRQLKVFEQVDRRIRTYVQRHLAVGPAEAALLQKDYHRRYGTTLRGLIEEHGIHPDAFLDFVHDIDHSGIEPDRRLTEAIAQLPGRKFIITNGSRRHAERVAERLGFTDHFEDIFDIVRAALLPKPDRRTYESFIAATGVAPAEAAMFEDLPRNLEVPKSLGMRTILVTSRDEGAGSDDDWRLADEDAAHIDHRTDDLAGFIKEMLTAIAR